MMKKLLYILVFVPFYLFGQHFPCNPENCEDVWPCIDWYSTIDCSGMLEYTDCCGCLVCIEPNEIGFPGLGGCNNINNVLLEIIEYNPTITKNFVSGWNMFGYPCHQSIDLSEAFSSIVEK